MASKRGVVGIQSRSELFDFLQNHMATAYPELRDSQRLEYENTLLKSYILEVDQPEPSLSSSQDPRKMQKLLESIFADPREKSGALRVMEKEETGFFELRLPFADQELTLFLDTVTDSRFWLGFSLSSSRLLDMWLESASQSSDRLDLVWLWPSFLETIQKRGEPRGFGLDYDYRKFEANDSDATTYLKMQLWGGRETADLYNLLKNSEQFSNRVVLSKVRVKEFSDPSNWDSFALQDIRYTGKFTTRGTYLGSHLATLEYVRREYALRVRSIEDSCSLRWTEAEHGGVALEGSAINFIPAGFTLPVAEFCDRVFDGTAPFRMIGFVSTLSETCAIVEAVDLHTGGELSFEVYPDIISVYLPIGSCGNSIIRFYTNLQHFFNVRFSVESDSGDQLLQPPGV